MPKQNIRTPKQSTEEMRVQISADTLLQAAAKYDAGKVRLDLLPVQPLVDIGQVLTYGAQKYDERNWEKGFAWSRPYAATLRHLFAWWSGEDNDPETGLSHLAHAACEVLFLQEFSYTHPELDDRPQYPSKEEAE